MMTKPRTPPRPLPPTAPVGAVHRGGGVAGAAPRGVAGAALGTMAGARGGKARKVPRALGPPSCPEPSESPASRRARLYSQSPLLSQEKYDQLIAEYRRAQGARSGKTRALADLGRGIPGVLIVDDPRDWYKWSVMWNSYTNPDYVLRHRSSGRRQCSGPIDVSAHPDNPHGKSRGTCTRCLEYTSDTYVGFEMPPKPVGAESTDEMKRQQQWSRIITQLTQDVMTEAGLIIDDERPWNWALVLTWSLYRVFAYAHGERMNDKTGDRTPYWDYMTLYMDMWSER